MAVFFHEARKFVALEQKYISMVMHLQLKCHIFNVLLSFVLFICVLFFFFLFI